NYRILTIVGLAAIYFVAAKLGLKLAYVYPSASTVWPGTGIALTAMLLLGYRVWPGIFLGAFLANVTTAGSVATSFGIALGNTIGSVLLTPLLVLWSINPHIRWNLSQVFERVLFLAFFLFVNLVVFGGLIPLSKENYPLEFLCVPFFIWAAFRFGPRETATAVV